MGNAGRSEGESACAVSAQRLEQHVFRERPNSARHDRQKFRASVPEARPVFPVRTGPRGLGSQAARSWIAYWSW
jgi:hypothetical protein